MGILGQAGMGSGEMTGRLETVTGEGTGMNRYLDGRQLDDVAIERLKQFESAAVAMHPDGYWVAVSGGKDSTVILDLAERSGVKFKAYHSLTTCDAPETVRYVQSLPNVQILKPEISMWQLIVKKGMPPLRQARYCCEKLKERGGEGCFVVTGVRSSESIKRSKRRMVDACYKRGVKRFIHVIIDWSTDDVWQYIRERGLRYNSLYDEGFHRVGCVLCPMTRNTQQQIARWPKLCAAWERAVKRTWKPSGDKDVRFASPEAYWKWWLDRDASLDKSTDPVMFDDDGTDSKP